MSIAAVICLDGLCGRRPSLMGATPVPFVGLAGVPLVSRQVLTLLEEGATRVVLLAGNHEARLRELIASDVRLRDAAVVVVSGGVDEALSIALESAARASDRVLIVAGDVFFGAGVVRQSRELEPATKPLRFAERIELWIAPTAGQDVAYGASELAAAKLVSTPRQPTASDAFLVCIDGPASVRAAKKALFVNVTKPTSGWISRNINAKFSKPVSWLISELPITPNMVTVVNTVIGMSAGYFFSRGDYFGVFMGGLIFQLAATLDRCDGEIARSKFLKSRFGAWIDTVGDNLTYFGGAVGLVIGAYRRSGDDITLYAGFGSLMLLALMLARMANYLARNTRSGSMTDVRRDVEVRLNGEKKPLAYRFLNRFYFVGKRDFFSMAVFIMGVFNLLMPLFWGTLTLIALLALFYGSGILNLRPVVRGASPGVYSD